MRRLVRAALLTSLAACGPAASSPSTENLLEENGSSGSSATGSTRSGDAGGGGSGRETYSVHTELSGNGSIMLETDLPALAGDCIAEKRPTFQCEDLDRDGLADAWEAVVLDRLRPLMRFDEDEQLFDDAGSVLADVARVALIEEKPLHARAFIMLGYSRDYGSSCLGVTAHNGDSERVALDLVKPQAGLPGTVEVVGAYTAAHEGSSEDRSRVFTGQDLGSKLRYVTDPESGEPRWIVYPSQNKHGTYANKDICEDASSVPCVQEDCAPDGVDNPMDFDMLPPIVNAGEDAQRLVIDLADVGFPGDDAWAKQNFCGGGGGDRADCSSSVRSKLLNDPYPTE
jgi:hypothetical protein